MAETRNWREHNVYPDADPETFTLIERFTRTAADTVEWSVTIDDPGAFNAPWDAEWDILWNEGQELQDYVCQENNKFLIDMHGDLGQPYFVKTRGG